MATRDLLKLPDDLECNLRKLLATPPPPHDTPGSRRAAPKPPAKPKKKRRAPMTPGPEPSQAALKAQAAHKRAKLAKNVAGKGKKR